MSQRSHGLAWFLCLGCLALGACAAPSPSPPAAPAAPEPEVRFTAAWAPADTRGDPALDVTVEMPLSWIEPSPKTVTLIFQPFELSAATAPGAFLAPLTGGQQEGAALTFAVEGGRLRAQYRASLGQHRHAPLRGIDNVPHATAGGWTVQGQAFLPVAMRLEDGRRLDLEGRLEGPALEGGHVMGAAHPAGSFMALTNTLHLFGRYRVQAVQAGPATVRLASADYGEAELAPMRALIADTLSLGQELLGSMKHSDLLIVVDRVGERHEGGVVGASSVVISGPDLGDLKASTMPGIIVVHELGHLWNRSDEAWLNEGFTRLFEISATSALDSLDPQASAGALAQRLRRYQILAGTGRAVRGDDTGSWPYEGGLAALICLDADLRAHGSSLLALHREVRQAQGEPIKAESFVARAEALAPGSKARLLARLDEPGPIDVGACLEARGLKVRRRQHLALAPKALVVDTLRLLGVQQRPLVVERVADGSAFVVGDQIVKVAGEGVHDVGSMQVAVALVKPGEGFDVEVLREGEPVTLRFAAPPEGSVLVPWFDLEAGASSGRLLP